MTNITKITLSAKELELVCNTDWILTKQHIIKKVIHLFGEILLAMQQLTEECKSQLPTAIFIRNAKISKGENYKDLPYVVLDYPRYFDKEEALAIRTMFWWGKFFSINLQLSGDIKTHYTAALTAHFLQLQQQGYSLCIGEDPWQHNFDENNYVPLQALTSKAFEAMLQEKPFIKIGKKIELSQWDNVAVFAERSFAELINLLTINYPNDEKDLSPGIPITGFGL